MVWIPLWMKKWSKKTPKNFLLFTILLIGYGSALFFFLIDDLGALKIPVVFYILGILLMAVTALRRSETVGTSSFTMNGGSLNASVGPLFYITTLTPIFCRELTKNNFL